MFYTIVLIDPLNKWIHIEEIFGERNAEKLMSDFKFHGGPQRVAFKYIGVGFDITTQLDDPN